MCFPTWVLHPLLEDFLESSHVEWFRGHAHEGHDLQELLFLGLAQLVDVVTAWKKIQVMTRVDMGNIS